jgi:ectoine hydroxylase-related dioxygenase (phytanoyl-CoA dioxygenase family)
MATSTAAPPLELTDQQVRDFYREGFLALPSITGGDDLRVIQRELDALFDRFHDLPPENVLDLGDEAKHRGEQVIPQILNPGVLAPKLRASQAYHNCLAIAKRLIGPDVAINWDHAIYKPPRNGKATPWHQDLSYAKRADPIAFYASFWIPLQDTSVEMGCMQFIPHSHLGDLLPHRPPKPGMHVLQTDNIDATFAKACPLPAGGCTIHQGKTLHYTGPNNTDTPRRAWIMVFGVPVAATWKGHRL